YPTTPLPSPTTTIAAKLNLRPPFTTFATRSMATTLSLRSISLAFTVLILLTDIFYFLEFQTTFPGAFGKCLHIAMVEITVAIEYDRLNTGSNRFLSQLLADAF